MASEVKDDSISFDDLVQAKRSIEDAIAALGEDQQRYLEQQQRVEDTRLGTLFAGETYSIRYKLRKHTPTGIVYVYYNRGDVCAFLAQDCAKERFAKTKSNVFTNWKGSLTPEQVASYFPTMTSSVSKKRVPQLELLTPMGLTSLLGKYEDKEYSEQVKAIRAACEESFLLLHSYARTDVVLKVEVRYMRDLASALTAAGIECVRGHGIRTSGGHKSKRVLDLWCPDLSIDIECDERAHAGYPADYRQHREEDVKRVYPKARFMYFNPHAEDFDWEMKRNTLVEEIAPKKAETPEKKKKGKALAATPAASATPPRRTDSVSQLHSPTELRAESDSDDTEAAPED